MKFITHRPLWVNILAGILLAVAIFALILLSLGWLTGHGKSATVPSVTGKSYDEAKVILKKAGFSVDVLDSVYVDTLKPHTVVRQLPDADEIVKSSRTVLLIISRAIPPLVEMPNLSGYSYRNVEMIFKSLGLKIGDTTSKPYFAKDAIMEQLYNGKIIAPGTMIRKGSSISLVLGSGLGEDEFTVPTITGMTVCDARKTLEEMGLSMGSIVPDVGVTDTCNAFIKKQSPTKLDDDKHIRKIRQGQVIDVWISVERPAKSDDDDDDEAPRKRKPTTDKPTTDDDGYQ